jgi:hypothetical protein
MKPTAQRLIGAGTLIILLVAPTAMAQVSQRLRGTIESVSGQMLVVKARDGKIANVKLADGAHVFTLNTASLADIKEGRLVGITAKRQKDGSQEATEIYIFPDERTHEPWDISAGSLVGKDEEVLVYIEGSILKNDGRALIIKYRDGEKTIPVPANVRVVMIVPATLADIKAGQNFFVPNGYQTSLGTEALTIIVGSNSVDFAM